jgi:Mn2+/Fe2+ NRAMP family transporter
MSRLAQPLATARRVTRRLAIVGPGLIVMLADCDAGNIIVAAQSGAVWGYALLPIFAALIPALYLVQQASADFGARTGKGFGELIRERFGKRCAHVCNAALFVTCITTLVTEFTGMAAVGDVFHVPRALSLGAAMAAVAGATLGARARRLERLIVCIGLLEAAFALMALLAHPDSAELVRQLRHMPLADLRFEYMILAIAGATFNPWMIFYHQKSLARSCNARDAAGASRTQTALGALLGQLFTMGIVVAVAASAASLQGTGFTNVGDIAQVFVHIAGPRAGYALFSGGVLASAFVAAVICATALSEGALELLPPGRTVMAASTAPGRSIMIVGILAACAAICYWLNDLMDSSVAIQVISCVFSVGLIGLFLWACRTQPMMKGRWQARTGGRW